MSTGEIVAVFRRDLPGLIRGWIVVSVAVPLLAGLIGPRSVPYLFWMGVVFLILGVPLAPLVWLQQMWMGFRDIPDGSRLKATGLFAGWALLTFFPALLVIIAVVRLAGVAVR